MKEMFTEADNTPESIRVIEPALSVYLRVTRQIERYRQLEIRQAELDQVAVTAHLQISAQPRQQTDAKSDPLRHVPK